MRTHVRTQHPTTQRSRYLEAMAGTLFLLLGCAIYVLFRARTIKLYRWLTACGLEDVMEKCRHVFEGWYLPDFILYSLPDGLYCASYILIMHAIWNVHPKHTSYLFVIFIPLVAVIHELSQSVGLSKGTFDLNDLICYLLPILLHILAVTKGWIKVSET